MVLSEEARQKKSIVSSYGKWEFKRCPFALAQAPAYFQRLTLSVPHVTIIMISHLVKKVPLQELLSATELSVRLV